jgi:soluble lytic murein transglycosylase
MTEYNAGWKVRAALRQPKIDWKWVIESIDEMPASQRDDTSWVYWKARGLAATGRKEQANALYAGIADRFDFYGQLSAEELGRRINVPPRPAPVSDREIAEARANPGLQRAVQLFRLGWRAEAVPEWNYTLRGMSDRQLMAAAELARAENIFDRVVNTSDRTEKEFDFSQRFIAPFEGRVTAKANAIALDPAWVYGLIRQESRFIMDARSHVGASGLMQLMPATAKWVAGKIGMTDFTPASVNDFDTNTELGTNYLNMVLRDLNGSQMLASAGYNAGPRRPHNWRSTFTHPVEGAIFAETIPFNETRTYVKNVMSNAVYYAAMFSGQSQSLKERLGNIVPLGAESTSIPRRQIRPSTACRCISWAGRCGTPCLACAPAITTGSWWAPRPKTWPAVASSRWAVTSPFSCTRAPKRNTRWRAPSASPAAATRALRSTPAAMSRWKKTCAAAT